MIHVSMFYELMIHVLMFYDGNQQGSVATAQPKPERLPSYSPGHRPGKGIHTPYAL